MPVSERPRGQAKFLLSRYLKKYTASEVASVNAHAKLLKGDSPWRSWAEGALTGLLEVPAGRRLKVTRSSEMHDEEVQSFTFEQRQEVTIGRAPESDIVLTQRSISRTHARFVEREDGFYLEDLESASGTFINKEKLERGQTRRLTNGDEIIIFPYSLSVEVEELWKPDEQVSVHHSCRFSSSSASDFLRSLGSDLCLFQLRISPGVGEVSLALGRRFLKEIISRLTRNARAELTTADAGLFEFVVVSILERANREVQFPFQWLLLPSDKFTLQEGQGLMLETTVRLSSAHGTILLFLPDSCLAALHKAPPAEPPRWLREELTWKLAVREGYVNLSLKDLEEVGPTDTLLYTPQAALLLPYHRSAPAAEQGWRATWRDKNHDALEIQSFFSGEVNMNKDIDETEAAERPEEEEEQVVEEEQITDDAAELKSLMVRVQVVLSEVELSLGELEGLSEGSVVELEGEQRGAVQLVANGRVLGAGELVKIDDRLGVEITRWRGR
jgi:type III secretion system YscQ/HrcQ family protein